MPPPASELEDDVEGLVLVTTVLATLPGGTGPGWDIAAVAVATLVFAAARGWTAAMRASAVSRAPLTLGAVGRETARHRALLGAGLPASLALLGAAVGLWSATSALWLGAGLNVAVLFAWGAGLRRMAGGGALAAAAGGTLTAALGVAMAALRVLVH